jgi:protein-tyrosine kinase
MSDPIQADQTIGAIIARAKGLNDVQVAEISRFQGEKGVKFGEAAVALGMASKEEILWALSQQFSYPYELGHQSELVVATSPFEDASEFFRDVRTQIIEGLLHVGTRGLSVAVCSAQPGDGKTYFASNLAVAFSQLGRRTLLVDGDMRAPRLGKLFGVEVSNTGLSTALSRQVDPTVHRPIDALPNLYVLPVGVIPPNPMELLQGDAFEQLAKSLTDRFDYVVYDTSSAHHGADCRVIAAQCHANVVVARKGSSAYQSTEKLVSQLRKRKPAFMAALLNEY